MRCGIISTWHHASAVQAVKVDIATIEDAWAVRLINMLTGLYQLKVEGMTREMYIWGNVQVWLLKILCHTAQTCCTAVLCTWR